jgi:hypothetical protein
VEDKVEVECEGTLRFVFQRQYQLDQILTSSRRVNVLKQYDTRIMDHDHRMNGKRLISPIIKIQGEPELSGTMSVMVEY